MPRYLIYSMVWAFTGDGKLKCREDMGEYIAKVTTIKVPEAAVGPIIDHEVSVLVLEIF